MTKEEYAKLYKERMNQIVREMESLPDYDGTQATYEFDQTATASEVVGYYVFNEGDNALKQWMNNIEGIKQTNQDKEVTKILKELYEQEVT